MADITLPYDDYMLLIQYREINHQFRMAISYKCAAMCRRIYGYPPKDEGFGFDTSPLPAEALAMIVDHLVAGSYTKLVGDAKIDVGLTSSYTMTGLLLLELLRRLIARGKRWRIGELDAGRATDHQEVPE